MQVSKSCYSVTGLGAIPPWMVNAGFIVGQEKTLIVDTGMNTLGAQTIYGYATAVRPQNTLLAMNLEPHFDHIGGNDFLQRQGATIYGHPKIRRTDAEFQTEREEYNQTIVNPIRNTAFEANAFFLDTNVVNPNNSIVTGDTFDLGQAEVEIIATPGHTALNLSAYHRDDKVLFCGDCIVNTYIPNLEAGGIDDWHSWLNSLETIEALSPEVIVPGHGNIIHKANVSDEILRMRDIITTAIKRGKSPTAI
ncbi:MAG: MBL fold metallo-hydrolase [Chloroflexota bacterium]